MPISSIGTCSAQYCSPQGNQVGPRPQTKWVMDVMPGSKVALSIFRQLNTVMNVELTVRGFASPTWIHYQVGDRVSTGMIKNIVDAIDQCREHDREVQATWTTYKAGKQLSTTLLSELRELSNNLQAVCVCNCNYCSCNCDYCGCDCNYKSGCVAFGATADQEKGDDQTTSEVCVCNVKVTSGS